MESLIPINIAIADRTYRIRVAPADEELVRKTLRYLNEKILEFKTQFAGKDMQDYVSMVLAWYATQPQQSVVKEIADTDVISELNRLEAILDRVIEGEG